MRMNRNIVAIGAGIVILLVLLGVYRSLKLRDGIDGTPTPVDLVAEHWTGDLDEALVQRRFVRALVSYNQTNFFIDKGTPRGIEYELLKRYEAFLNQDRKPGELNFKVVFTVLPFDRLLPALLEGRGDIVAAGLTVTEARLKSVAFASPYLTDISEVLVTGRHVDDIRSIQDLYGRIVHVLSGSSYVAHLEELNRPTTRRLKPPIAIIQVDPPLEEEDILQMIHAGISDLTVVDSHIADIWSRVLDNIQVRPDIVVNSGGRIAWAVRKNNPRLLASLNDFFKTHRQGTFALNLLVERYYKDTRWIQNPLSGQEQQRFEQLMGLFQKYAAMYNFDWMKIAALAYQESGLNQAARSHRGAVGVMQVLPATAAGPAIGIMDIDTVENNIHAGVKYLAHLRDTYFDDPDILPVHRTDFAFAAYNAGPTRINRLRRQAQDQGLDPNQWFFNVEHVARRDIGRETVQYVTNIYIYYVAYRTAYGVGRLPVETPAPENSDQNASRRQGDGFGTTFGRFDRFDLKENG
jgi:membrane-bound lytic murein transglycosylase MltF